MSYQFSDKDKEVREFQEQIPFGVSEVQFVGAAAGETTNGKEYIEVGVVNKEGIEDSVRLFFVGGASNISFNTLRAIAVHTAKDDAAKEKARTAVDAVKDADELCNLLNTNCSGGQIWFTKYYDANRTYINQSGATKRSVNKNIYGYEPKLKPELMPNKSDDELTKENLSQAFPDAEDITNKSDAPRVPDSWS